MIRRFIYNILLCSTVISLMTLFACSEDSLSPIDELGKTIYDPSDAPEDANINAFYEKYGSRILYDFNRSDLAFGWSSSRNYWYAPVKAEYKHYISDVTLFLKDKAFQKYPDTFIEKYLPFRIFFVDSICNTVTYDKSRLQDVMQVETHGVAIAHLGKEMDTWTEGDWNTLQTNVLGFVLNSIYQPFKENYTIKQFGSLQQPWSYMLDIEDDPQGEFSNIEYSLYANTYVDGEIYLDNDLIIPPYNNIANDLGQYISFILTTPKSKMDKIFARADFEILKQRALLVANFIKNRLMMDPIAMQNEACPDDPYPSDYFND